MGMFNNTRERPSFLFSQGGLLTFTLCDIKNPSKVPVVRCFTPIPAHHRSGGRSEFEISRALYVSWSQSNSHQPCLLRTDTARIAAATGSKGVFAMGTTHGLGFLRSNCERLCKPACQPLSRWQGCFTK